MVKTARNIQRLQLHCVHYSINSEKGKPTSALPYKNHLCFFPLYLHHIPFVVHQHNVGAGAADTKGMNFLQIYRIHMLLHQLGISRRFTAYSIFMEISLLILHSDSIFISNHDMLSAIAQHRGCKVENIERNLHTAISQAWLTSPDYLCTLAGYSLTKEPSVSEFLDILARALLRSRTGMTVR